ncbi:hypothetical protein [Natronoarchaeum rubrum]|uniref:hypothetical protein n=1 Tax=Natronoarchaeum rubrum TaxID=755311 RepID=UPI002111E514|nr:hypothetical protein [Natronoarchaeum rubrum]
MMSNATAGTFEGWDCPCDADQPDPERLYCEDCIERMGREMAEELAEQHDETANTAK